MGDELKLGLYIIGLLLIGGIFAHGLWSIRKNKEQLRDYKEPPRSEPGFGKSVEDEGGLDDHGVGQPRAVGGSRSSERAEPSIGASVEEVKVDVDEPQITQDIEIEPTAQPAAAQSDEVETKNQAPSGPPAEVLIIHIGMPEKETISGASLLPALISMGFKFGEMDIFHRHEDAAGNGEVLFSLADMFNPGTFDIDNMEQVSLRGLSLFLRLPCAGEALQNFNMMHNCAKKLAEQFGGHLLDSKRSNLTVQTVRHYVEKIREFERQQLING